MNKTLKILLLIVFLSLTLSFSIKYLGFQKVIPWNIAYNDIVSRWYNKPVLELPYINTPVEYPILTGLTMYFASQYDVTYFLFFHYIVFLLSALVTTYFIYKLALEFSINKKYLYIFWALSPSLIWFSYFNWDMIAVMFTTIAIYYYNKRKDIIGTIFLSLGFATKLYPILILFPVLMHRKFNSWIKNGFVFVLTFIFLNHYFILKNFKGWLYSYTFHSTRGPNIDSIWNYLGLSIESVNIVTLLLFVSLYFYFNLKYAKNGFIFNSFISILLFIIVNKIFSPQYLLWLLPFFVLINQKLFTFYILEISNILILIFTNTFSFSDSMFALTLSGIFVFLRHLLLISMLIRNTGIFKDLKLKED